MCLNLIINLPYCEKWVSLELLFFFKAKVISVEWSSQLSLMGAVRPWLWEWQRLV